MKKNGIALLITLLFIIAITASIGVGLKQINDASKEAENEAFMLQSRVVLDDVMNLLKTSTEVDFILKDNSAGELYAFISQLSFIPLNLQGLHVSIEIKSARAKFNPNDLVDSDGHINTARVQMLKAYVSRYNINSSFVDLMLDNMGKIKEDMSYNSAIFNDKPTLLRDYIASFSHFKEIESYYEKTYNDNSLKNIDFEKLFYFSAKKGDAIDLNYATPEVWQMLIGADQARAEILSAGGGSYTNLEDIGLSGEEKTDLARFATSFFEPSLDVKIEITRDLQSSVIRFEYDMKTKKGSNYVYEL